MESIPTVVWILLGLAVIGMVVVLVDLARHEVLHLPKWQWALIVILVSFPIGAIVYFVAGRVPSGGSMTAPEAHLALEGSSIVVEPGRAEHRPDTDAAPVVSTDGLVKIYGDTIALDDVHLAVPRGSVYGLIGPNGAGKTTMLSIIAGLRRPTSGSFRLTVPRSSLGVLVDTPQFEPWLTAHEVVDLSRHLTAPDIPEDRVAAVLAEAGLGDAIGRRVGGFSRGMLQRLGIAACLVGAPEVLLLDEPSSALDPAGRREVLDLIGRLAHTTTVILSTHILGDVQQVCDTVGVIDRGRLRYQGPVADLLARTTTAYVLHVRSSVDGLATALRSRPWAIEITEQSPGRLRLVVSDAGWAEAEIPGLVTDHGAPLVSFYPATDLETAFLELTGGGAP